MWLCVCVCVLDATGDKELLQNIPEIRDEFNILSKIGEGQFKDVALCSVKGRVYCYPSHVTWVRSFLHVLVIQCRCTVVYI